MKQLRAKLLKAPLKEVIFEIHWLLEVNKLGQQYDPFYDFGKGKYFDKVKDKFPHKRDIPVPTIQNVNIRIIDSPLHQFWSGDGVWPVIQLGQGILTVNDTDKNYKWESTFKSNIEFALKCLLESNPSVFRFNKLVLKYIDAVDIQGSETVDWRSYIDQNLRISIKNDFEAKGKLSDLNINQAFDLSDGSRLVLAVNSSKNSKTLQPALVWQTIIEKKSDIKFDDIMTWAEYGHDTISELFHSMLNKDFYDSFK